MIQLLIPLLAFAVLGYSLYWFRGQTRAKRISQMNNEELVDAIIARKISILEVPQERREAVNTSLQEIQSELDNY